MIWYSTTAREEVSQFVQDPLNLTLPFGVKPFGEAVEIPRMELDKMDEPLLVLSKESRKSLSCGIVISSTKAFL